MRRARAREAAGPRQTPLTPPPRARQKNMPCCIECIQTAEVGIVERCGKYYRQAGPGANCVCYPVDEIVGVVNMRVQHDARL